MRIAIFTNDDLTGNLIFSPVLDLPAATVTSVVFSDSPVKGRSTMFTAAWKLRSRMAFRYWLFLVLSNGLFAIFSKVSATFGLDGSFGELDSLRAHARRAGIPVTTCADFNAVWLKQLLRQQRVDLLLMRVSAILDAELLAIPKIATWCVHSSILPAFAGIAGEFQAVREGKQIGSTVFKVTDKLDDGPPLAQIAIETKLGGTLFSHIVQNNRAAGQLLSQMVVAVTYGGRANGKLLNDGLAPSYFSWPKAEELAEFRRKGWKLMSFAEFIRLGLAAIRLRRGLARFS